MIRTVTFMLICLSACYAQQAQLTFGGVIEGLLKGEDGTAIVGGHVTLHRMPPYPPGRLRRTIWVATSGVSGSFRFDALYFGPYRLCVQVPGSTWLNPCEWGLRPPTVMLSTPQPSASVTITVKKGVAVPIRVDDPGQLLSQHEGKTPGAHLLLGVSNDVLVFHPAPLTSQDSNGRNHQILIPFDATVKLVVSSSFFQLNDAAGIPLPRTGSIAIPVNVQTGQQPIPIKFTVTGAGR